jgi:hypothetical protein
MKIVITHSKTYGSKLKQIIDSAYAAGEKGITLFSTSDINEELLRLLNKTPASVKMKMMRNAVFMVKGILIELIIVDGYE